MGEVKQVFSAKPGFSQKPGLWSRRKAQAEADAKLDEVMANWQRLQADEPVQKIAGLR